MKKVTITIVVLVLGIAVQAQTAKDTLGIKEAALNYLEGWYAGDAERMDKALHPDLVKRNMQMVPNTEVQLVSTSTKHAMVQFTEAGFGTRTPKDKIKNKVKVVHIYKGIALAIAISYDYVDYLQLVKTNDGWKILNVLWDRRDHEE
jgi:hypothetical protein